MEISLSENLKNNQTYKIYFKNDGHMVLEKYQTSALIRMFFDKYIKENNLDIINYFLKYESDISLHILYFDTLEEVDHISLKQIIDYIINNINKYGNQSSKFNNVDLRFIKAYTEEDKTAKELREEEKDKNILEDLFDNQGTEKIEKILMLTAGIYLLSILKDFSDMFCHIGKLLHQDIFCANHYQGESSQYPKVL